MYYAVDRFEGELAVLQDDEERCVTVERTLLPAGVSQGDVLTLENGKYIHAREETQRRRDPAPPPGGIPAVKLLSCKIGELLINCRCIGDSQMDIHTECTNNQVLFRVV